jgi:hypothetical protein
VAGTPLGPDCWVRRPFGQLAGPGVEAESGWSLVQVTPTYCDVSYGPTRVVSAVRKGTGSASALGTHIWRGRRPVVLAVAARLRLRQRRHQPACRPLAFGHPPSSGGTSTASGRPRLSAIGGGHTPQRH